MKRTLWIVSGAIAAILVALIVGPFTFYASVAPVLSPVLPRPEGVPKGATASYDWKASGVGWTWSRTSEHGCASWMANERWADVQLLLASGCGGERPNGYRAGRGLSYFSVEDHLTFQGFWPWSAENRSAQFVYDAQGMIEHVRPCPHALSSSQISAMRIVAREALAQAETDGERRVLTRVRQRLDAMGDEPLSSGQGGCTDRPVNDRGPVQRKDVWGRL